MTRALFILWLGLIGAERLDLSGGALPVTLTPFLILTPPLLVALATRRLLRRSPVAVTRGAQWYLLLMTVFLCQVGVSTLGSLDADATLSRGALLLMQMGGAALVALLIHDDSGLLGAMRTGATLGVLLCLAVNVLAVLSFVGILPEALRLGTVELRLDSYGYAGIIPRFSGTTIDPNGGGLLLMIFALLAPRVRALAVFLLVLTLSRSAALAGIALLLAAAWQHGVLDRPAPTRGLLAGLAMAGLILVAVGRSPATLETTGRTLAPFAERVGAGDADGSASDHVALVIRAAEEGSKSVQRAAIGLGWGASHAVLQDYFPGNRYGSFHSMYGTVFAETGVMSLIVMLLLLGVPLARRTRWQPAVAGFIVFNVFYQSNTVPAFWLLLALSWMTAVSTEAPVDATA